MDVLRLLYQPNNVFNSSSSSSSSLALSSSAAPGKKTWRNSNRFILLWLQNVNITTPSVIATKQTCFTKVWHFVVHDLKWENKIFSLWLSMHDWIQSLTISKGGMWLLAEYENKRLNSEHIQQDVVDSTKCTQNRRFCRLQRNASSEVPVHICFCHWHSEIFKSTFYVTTCFIKHSWLLNKRDEIDQENMENRKTY